MTRLHPGTNELEWLADLKPLAERIGEQVLGFAIDWRVETAVASSATRSDVRVEDRRSHELIFSGEAKRPDDPRGLHPLVDSEVSDAVKKAQHHGGGLCFTTNFHHIALLDAGAGLAVNPVLRLRGELIDFVPEQGATAPGWWRDTPAEERERLATAGLRTLFERYRALRDGEALTKTVDEVVIGFLSRITDALLEPLTQTYLAHRESMPAGMRHRALAAGLDPNENQDCRYLVAQGIAEVLSAALFHQVLRDHFAALDPLLRGTSPRGSRRLAETVMGSLADAVRESGDYQPILELSIIAEWAMRDAPEAALAHWRSLFAFVEQLEVASTSGDVLGTIFERLIAPERRHEMGQHYTQPRLARAMAHWGVRDPDDRVLDPACGAGTFLVETYGRHRALGLDHDAILERTYGNDLDPFATHLASINLATRRIRRGNNHPAVRQGDAFELEPGLELLRVVAADGSAVDRALERVDVLITNPPFRRTHPDEEHARARLARLFGPTGDRPPSLRAANLAAWFLVLGAALEPKRMAYVMPIPALQNTNLVAWRAWVRKRFDLTLWHTEHDIWFSDARVGTCVVLLEPRQQDGESTGRFSFVDVGEPVSGELYDLSGVPAPTTSGAVRELDWVEADDDMLIHGVKPPALLAWEERETVVRLDAAGGELASGTKLGHDWYKVEDCDPARRGQRREVSGLGTSFPVARRFLTPLLGGPKELRGGEVQPSGLYLLTLPRERPRANGLRGYVELGEHQGVHEKPSVASRPAPWWSITAPRCDVALPTHAQFKHEIAWFPELGVANNNFHTATFADRDRAELVAASLASAFGALSRLYVSCEIGCEGARHVLLPQLKRWGVLDPSQVSEEAAKDCLKAYREYRAYEAAEMDALRADAEEAWRKLTRVIARAAFDDAAAADVLVEEAIEECQETVRRRRRRETLALLGRTRASSGQARQLATRVRSWAEESELVRRAAALLLAGDEPVVLRAVAEINQGSLFDPGSTLALYADRERELSELLGSGFRCAPPHPADQADEFGELLAVLRALQEEVPIALVGEPPAEGDPALGTWEGLREEVLAVLWNSLQSEIRDELA